MPSCARGIGLAGAELESANHVLQIESEAGEVLAGFGRLLRAIGRFLHQFGDLLHILIHFFGSARFSIAAVAICMTISPTCSAMWMISFSEPPAWMVDFTPSSTCLVPVSMAVTAVLVSCWMFLIMPAISLVAVVVRSASLRTSSATTG